MWLLDVTTYTLTYFETCPVGEYAILSHRWQEDEPNFQELSNGGGRGRIGFRKIARCCAQAYHRGLKYAWIDTCCIDKRSSAELSEAINSMFAWYASAKECYVYMFDVESESLERTPNYSLRGAVSLKEDFSGSVWFERGWTLQELLAPRHQYFFDKDWQYLGSRQSLENRISAKTGIEIDVLRANKRLSECSVAQRLSWASCRKTTRTEDIAYCLLGVFDISMPLLYGEGRGAFVRLQERIIRQNDDESIFAWTEASPKGSGLLATNVSTFTHMGHVLPVTTSRGRKPYFMTHKGLAIEGMLMPVAMHVYLVPLNCSLSCLSKEDQKTAAIGVYVCQSSTKGRYRRITWKGNSLAMFHFDQTNVTTEICPQCCATMRCGPSIDVLLDLELPVCADDLQERLLYISQNDNTDVAPPDTSYARMIFSLDHGHSSERGIEMLDFHIVENSDESEIPTERWTGMVQAVGWIGNSKSLDLGICSWQYGAKVWTFGPSNYMNQPSYVQMGFDFDFNPICVIGFHFPPLMNGSYAAQRWYERSFWQIGTQDTTVTGCSRLRYTPADSHAFLIRDIDDEGISCSLPSFNTSSRSWTNALQVELGRCPPVVDRVDRWKLSIVKSLKRVIDPRRILSGRMPQC